MSMVNLESISSIKSAYQRLHFWSQIIQSLNDLKNDPSINSIFQLEVTEMCGLINQTNHCQLRRRAMGEIAQLLDSVDDVARLKKCYYSNKKYKSF